LAAELLDTGVNMGTGTATGFLQRALNALNRNGRDYHLHPADATSKRPNRACF
jgi:lysozyme family protein